MDCQAARLLFWFKRPHAKELLAEDEAALSRHLADCPTCSRLARLVSLEDRHLSRAIRDVSVPAGLTGEVVTLLDQARLSATAAQRRQWMRRIATLVAACVLVVAGSFAWWYWQPVPAASVREMEWWALNRFSLPGPTPAAEKWSWLEQFFYSHQVWFRVPEVLKARWDFSDLATAYVAEFSHERVAVLEFRKPGGHALVFVLPTAHCTSADWRDFQPSSDRTILLRSQPDEDFTCLVVLKEGQIGQFLLPGK